MPWKETRVMDQKTEMVGWWLGGESTITELSRTYGVSRKTVYKWVERYRREGAPGLDTRSSRPYKMPRATPPGIIAYLTETRARHRHWGARKILAWLHRKFPDTHWPAPSTVNEILKREGMVKPPRRHRRTPPYGSPFLECTHPNRVWCADFKGQFRLGEGSLCYPLTISDGYSRYLLCCRGLARPTYENVQPYFEDVFKEWGLPEAIRTDNGAPFASVALGGLSHLAAWFVKLGIRPERIEVGHPEQNGRHERMHRTLKEAVITPPRHDFGEQQRAFNRFKEEYNHERPHEAIGQKTPASVYKQSPRSYPRNLPRVEYDSDWTVRHVRTQGCIKWKGGLLYVSEALIGEPVGLREIDNNRWEVRYSFHPLGVLDERLGKIMPVKV